MTNSSTSISDTKISEPKLVLPGSEIFFTPKNNPVKPAPRIALVASIAWTLWNYRLTLIQALEKAGYEVILVAADDASRVKLECDTNARFHPLRRVQRSSISPLTNLSLLFELYASLRHLKPDVVLLFTIRPNTLGNFAAAALGIPAISTIEGMGSPGSTTGWLRWLMQWMYRLAFRSTSKVIFLNPDDHREFIQKKIVKPSKSILIPGPGINLKHFQPWRKRTQSASPVFIFVGRLLSEKGIREFAAAARIFKKEGISAIFRVVGGTDSGNPTSIDSVEINSWVQEGILEYEGFAEDVRPAIADADVLVLPSYYREGVPRSVLEGMAMGKIIITTDNVGCRDTVEEAKNGFLVPARDPEALASAMKKILLLPGDKRRQMGGHSRRKVKEEFTDQLVLPRYLELIRALLK